MAHIVSCLLQTIEGFLSFQDSLVSGFIVGRRTVTLRQFHVYFFRQWGNKKSLDLFLPLGSSQILQVLLDKLVSSVFMESAQRSASARCMATEKVVGSGSIEVNSA